MPQIKASVWQSTKTIIFSKRVEPFVLREIRYPESSPDIVRWYDVNIETAQAFMREIIDFSGFRIVDLTSLPRLKWWERLLGIHFDSSNQ